MNRSLGSAVPFYTYLGGSSLWLAGFSLQGFLMSALLVYVLELPAAQTGSARFLAELPPLLILFLGGVLGDRYDGRRFLLWMHSLIAVPPLLIAAAYGLGALSYGVVVLFGVLMASIQSLSDPARQAILSRVAHLDVQRAVTLMTVITSTVGILGLLLGAQLNRWGVIPVLMVQSGLYLLGALVLYWLPPLPPLRSGPRESMASALTQGFRATAAQPLVRNFISLNFLSSLFNAGAYIIAVPYLLTEVYSGGPGALARAMIIFTLGSIGSNLLLLRLMPLRHPGRLWLLMQLTRIVILALIYLEPAPLLFDLLLIAWGLNMGVTTTLVRTTVQELAPPDDRARVLSVLLFSFMVSSPVSALVLGALITLTSATAALLPGIMVSLLIFVLGTVRSGLWHYRSPEANLNPARAER